MTESLMTAQLVHDSVCRVIRDRMRRAQWQRALEQLAKLATAETNEWAERHDVPDAAVWITVRAYLAVRYRDRRCGPSDIAKSLGGLTVQDVAVLIAGFESALAP
jgi:hypothetical protein